jgi:hypothetical protein
MLEMKHKPPLKIKFKLQFNNAKALEERHCKELKLGFDFENS